MESYLVQLRGGIHERRFPGQVAVTVSPGRAALERWTLALCMLKERVVEVVRLTDSETGIRLLVTHLETAGARCSVDVDPSGTTFSLSAVELDRWCYFYLKCIRDGYAEVDHIEVDSDEGTFTLIGKAPAYAPAVSADEARRRLKEAR